MRDFRDAKTMAQTLRDNLSSKNVRLTHSESLEIIAKVFGLDNWNILAARIRTGRSQDEPPPKAPAEGAVRLPEGVLPVLPLRDIVVFPHQAVPLFVGRKKSIGAVDQAMASDQRILLVAQRAPGDDTPDQDALYQVGVVAGVQEIFRLPDGSMKVMVRGADRVAVTDMIEGASFIQAAVSPLPEERPEAADAADLAQEAVGQFVAYAQQAETPAARGEAARSYLAGITQPGALADVIAQRLRIDLDAKQKLLETTEGVERLRRVLAAMSEPADG